MKSAFLLLLLLPVYVHAQSIPKGADKIRITTSLPDSVLYAETVDFLESNSFIMSKADAKRLTLITEYRQVGSWYATIRILAVVQKGVLTIKGLGASTIYGYASNNVPLIYRGLPTALPKGGFKYLSEWAEKLAKNLGATLDYVVSEQ